MRSPVCQTSGAARLLDPRYRFRKPTVPTGNQADLLKAHGHHGTTVYILPSWPFYHNLLESQVTYPQPGHAISRTLESNYTRFRLYVKGSPGSHQVPFALVANNAPWLGTAIPKRPMDGNEKAPLPLDGCDL